MTGILHVYSLLFLCLNLGRKDNIMKEKHKRSSRRTRGSVNRNYKDTVFRKLFSEKEKLIELYNALEDANYGPDTKVEITTLEDALFVDRKNDLSFTIDDRYVIMAEHQSTEAPNIPLRHVVYMGRTLENLVLSEAIYRKKNGRDSYTGILLILLL